MVLVSTPVRPTGGRRLNAVGRDVQSGPRTTRNNPRSSGDSQLGGGKAIAAAGLAPGPELAVVSLEGQWPLRQQDQEC
jgi:hypothetical protein